MPDTVEVLNTNLTPASDNWFKIPKSSAGTNSTEDMTSVHSQAAVPVEKADESCLNETFAVVTNEKLNANMKNIAARPSSRNSYSPATTELSLSSFSSSSSLHPSSSHSPGLSTRKTLSETDKLYKIIDQLKMEKQCLVNSVIKLSAQADEDQRVHRNEKTQLMSELSTCRSFCEDYEKSRRNLETNITEILRSEITDDGLPVVHDELIEKCQVAIRESVPLNASKLCSRDSDNLDIFIDHYNFSVMIEANLADENGGKVNLNKPVGISSDSDLTDLSSSQKSVSGSYGDITASKIAKLPAKYLDRKLSNNSIGREISLALSTENSTSSRSKLSPSERSYGSHVSMDSLRRRSMMETRMKYDIDSYGSDHDSVISSISEHGNDRSNKQAPKENRRKGGRRGCICGAYGPRRERTKPSSYRYYDEDGNLVIMDNGNSLLCKNAEEFNEFEAPNPEMEDEFDNMNLYNTEVKNVSPGESAEKKNSFSWKWW